MHASDVTPEIAARANDLYWSSDHSVNRIAEDLDLSKGALYGVLVPLQTGFGCPACGGEAVVPNRTARDRALLECSVCTWVGSAGEAVGGADTKPDATHGQDAAHGEGDLTEPEAVGPPPSTARSDRGRIMAGGALLGAAAGLAFVLWTRRR